MLKNNFKKSISAILILISLSSVTPFLTTTYAVNSIITPSNMSLSTINPIIIDAKDYSLDITGTTDTSTQ